MRGAIGPLVGFRDAWPGGIATLAAALAAFWLARATGAPVMPLALILGIGLSGLYGTARLRCGIDLVAQRVLRIGVALLGLRITFTEVAAIGWEPFVMVISATALILVVGQRAARLLGFSGPVGLVAAGAVAICGASAAAALAATLPSDTDKERALRLTVACVSLLSMAAMLLYPLLAGLLGLSPVAAGVFIGATIHDVAQVVGAGYGMSVETGDTAVVVKLARVMMLVPVLIWAAIAFRPVDVLANGRSVPRLPVFILGFLGLLLIGSTTSLPDGLRAAGIDASSFCLVAAMAAVGMKTRLADLSGIGGRLALLLVFETVLLAVYCGAWVL